MRHYNEAICEHDNEIMRLRTERDRMKKQYVKDAFKESGCFVGQRMVDRECKLWYVSGAFESRGDVFLLFNKCKKDGTMSKISGLGKGMPHVKIK